METLKESLEELHEAVDLAVRRLLARGAWQPQCGLGCRHCCVDGLTVFEVEAELIQRRFEPLLRGLPHPEGACAFLDDAGACRIYEHRPYVCRTQGLPLRWIDEDAADGLCEMRDICPENEAACDVLVLDSDACWLIGPFEERLRSIQTASHAGSLKRVSLRSLFIRS